MDGGIIMFGVRYKIKPERNCDTCEFNFVEVCAGHGTRIDNGQDTYGMPMDKAYEMFPNGCDDWGISFGEYCRCVDDDTVY